MENQFDTLELYEIDPNVKYFCIPTLKSKGFTLLMKFSLMGKCDLIKRMLELYKLYKPTLYKNFVNQTNNIGFSALSLAVANLSSTSNIETVTTLLNYGADVNTKSTNDWSPLMIAARYNKTDGNNEIFDVLLEYGANINDQNNIGYTTLMLMVFNLISNDKNDTSILQLLIYHGADINILNSNGDNALAIALNNSNKYNKIVEYLTEQTIKEPIIISTKDIINNSMCNKNKLDLIKGLNEFTKTKK